MAGKKKDEAAVAEVEETGTEAVEEMGAEVAEVGNELKREDVGTIPEGYNLIDVRQLVGSGTVEIEQWHLWGYDERRDALQAFRGK